MINFQKANYRPPEHQPDATLSQDNPASGTKYTVLDTTPNVRIIDILVKVTWTVQPTPLELHLTIDGRNRIYSVSDPVSLTTYVPHYENFADENGILGTTIARLQRSFFTEAQSIKVEVEITGGTVSNLSARVKYAKW